MRFYYFVILLFVFTGELFAQEKEVIMEKTGNNSSAWEKDTLPLSPDEKERYKEFTITLSRFDVETTVNRIKQNLKEMEIPVFALI